MAHATQIRTPVATLLLSFLALNGQVNVLTYHNDLGRTGLNPNETILSPSSLQANAFGLLFSHPVDGQVYGQPLYMWGLMIPGKGLHNVLFVVTEHDSVYAFDADSNTGTNAAPLWQASFINPAAGVTPVPAASLGCNVIAPELGISSTPVIDPISGTLYVAAMTLEDFGQTYVHRLHALDVATGAEWPGSPVRIEASVPGTGDGNQTVTFKPWLYKERAGLLLLNGVVYTAWSSHCDAGGYHGWVIGHDAKTLQRVAAYASTPNWDAGSIWQSGAAPAADANGNIYIVTGNGTFDADRGGADLGDSVIKLSTASGLAVADYFTPFNAASLDAKDLDLGSSGALLLPDSAGTSQHPHLLVTGGKEGRVYLLDRDRMGHSSQGSDSQIVQSLPSAVGPLFGVPAYFNNTLFFGARNAPLRAFPIVNGLLSQKPASEAADSVAYLGSVPSISANGSKDGIVWTIQPDALHAYDAENLASELYRGRMGAYIKFSTPTIANGKVYAGTENTIAVFGLLKAPAIDAILNAGGNRSGAVAPGSIVSVYGTNLTDGTQARIWINGIAAPLLSAGPNQINAQIPYETPAGIATAVASKGGSSSASMAIQVQPTAPGIFSVILNPDGSVNGPGNAAAPGSTLLVFATGVGPMVAVSATIGDQNVPVISASLAPGLIGIFQVLLSVTYQPPGTYSLAIQAAGILSNSVPVSMGR